MRAGSKRGSLYQWVLVAFVVAGGGFPEGLAAQVESDPLPEGDPLAPFEFLIGGEWHLDGSYQVFEWGVGNRSVKSQSYFVANGVPKLVSEGVWFWHPGEGEIKGVFTAVNMPFEFFDYTTRFEGDQMVNDLRSFDSTGGENFFVETWSFIDDTTYRWALLQEVDGAMSEVMSGLFERRRGELQLSK